ncbi:DUF3592 domain-containing protein [Saccharibacillus sp. CPCC 101409]|uniref:DUF3592 domain-containing protein n=1 Tax=Saccharibacillus sp. CPCC 101409 TaxID=3058041 RepID=UPI002671449A|nr:DUF3592 domain-containing protein [Saccharibacillus sp. CPCC 101409]MDO3409901.1 DUF3592 domain-containing protein [Saccharibacillus sp. CPCC 101409]
MPLWMLGILIPGGVLTLLGIAFTLIGLTMRRRSADWIETEGIIVKQGEILRNFPDRRPTFAYRTKDGSEYMRTSAMSQSPGFWPDTRVRVKYNPDDPQQAVIDSPAQSGLVFLIIGVVMLPIGLIILLGGTSLAAFFTRM